MTEVVMDRPKPGTLSVVIRFISEIDGIEKVIETGDLDGMACVGVAIDKHDKCGPDCTMDHAFISSHSYMSEAITNPVPVAMTMLQTNLVNLTRLITS